MGRGDVEENFFFFECRRMLFSFAKSEMFIWTIKGNCHES